MSEASILRWFRDSSYGELVREVYWLFPTLEIVHFIALCLLFGALLFMDLRILGFSKAVPLQTTTRFVPVALLAFALALGSGLGFFCSAPLDYWPNPSFRLKILLIFVAGANALCFELFVRRRVSAFAAGEVSLAARYSAALSLTLWTVIIVLGRVLPYTGPSQ